MNLLNFFVKVRNIGVDVDNLRTPNMNAQRINFNFNFLTRLGVASRDKCQEALLKTGWSVELAASILLEAA